MMMLTISVNELINIGVIIILSYIAVHHFFIYISRLSKEERYNIDFSLFILSVCMYIFFTSSLQEVFFHRNYKYYPFLSMIIILSVIFMFIFSIQLLKKFLDISEKYKKLLLYTNIFLSISIVLTGFSFFMEWKTYLKNIYFLAFGIGGLGGIYFTSIFLVWFIKNQLYKKKAVLFTAGGVFIILISIFVERIYNIIFPFHSLSQMFNIGFALSITILSIGISYKYQKEYKELVITKLKLENFTKNLEKKVKERTLQLEEANKEKTNFYINIAHETKTPLTLISNYLEKYIKSHGITPELDIIKNNINKLKTDIINYFDIEKSEKGKILYDHRQIIDLVQTLTYKAPLFSECALKKNIEVTYVNKLTNAYIQIDPSAFERIINNIFDNAVKFTDHNGIITICLDEETVFYNLSIKDSGIGIPVDQLDHIFEPYFQASHEKKQFQGMGVGLSIVKKIILEINGTIEVKSQLGKGTEILIKLPKYKIKADDKVIKLINNPICLIQPLVTKLPTIVFNESKKNVLLVEDNVELLSGMITELMDLYNSYHAVNGKDALTKLAEIPKPDIIISDIMMDIMDGYEFYHILQNNPDYKNIPFIFLTAKTSLEERINGLKKGAVDYISKPVNFEELSAKIASILNVYEALKEDNLKIVEKKVSEIINKQLYKNDNTGQISIADNISIPIEKLYYNYKISRREIEVLSLIKNGYEYKEIADILNISENTVETYRMRLFKKCNVANKAELLQIFTP